MSVRAVLRGGGRKGYWWSVDGKPREKTTTTTTADMKPKAAKVKKSTATDTSSPNTLNFLTAAGPPQPMTRKLKYVDIPN
jgi:hypothetical protein